MSARNSPPRMKMGATPPPLPGKENIKVILAKQSQFFLKLKKPKDFNGPLPASLRHLRPAALEDLRNPIGVGETATGKGLELLVHVIFHAPDRELRVIHQEICCAAIAVVRKTHAAGVGDDHS